MGKRTKIVAAACVKNEIDIVEAFVRHTLAFVDQLVVLDNGSNDGTLDVLYSLKREGLPLDISEDPSLGKYQAQRMTHLMRDVAVGRYDADWVVLLDCDEFLGVEQPEAPLISEGVGKRTPLSVEWRTYVPTEKDDPSELNPVVRLRHRRTIDFARYAKTIVPRTIAEHPRATVAQGNHFVALDGQPCEPMPAKNVYLAHFPLRNPAQFLIKVAISSFQYQTMAARSEKIGFHYKDLYQLLKTDVRAFKAELYKAALKYSMHDTTVEPVAIEEPFEYRGGPLRYTPRIDEEVAAWRSVLLYTEKLAQQYAVATANLNNDQLSEIERQAAVIADLHAQLEERRKQYDARLAQAGIDFVIEEIKQSWTWRVGRLLVGPTTKLIGPSSIIGKFIRSRKKNSRKAA